MAPPMRRAWLGIAITLAFTAGLGAVGCGNGANSVDACRQLEGARCARAQGCGIDLGYPLHTGSSAADAVTACQSFYQIECLHGMVTPKAPTSTEVNDCLDAIEKGDCNTVVNPQDNAACAWLIPPDAGVEAGVDAAKDVGVDSYVAPPVDAGVDANPCDPACEANCSPNDPICTQECGC